MDRQQALWSRADEEDDVEDAVDTDTEALGVDGAESEDDDEEEEEDDDEEDEDDDDLEDEDDEEEDDDDDEEEEEEEKEKEDGWDDDDEEEDEGAALVEAAPRKALPGPRDKKDRPKSSGTVPSVPRRKDD